MPDVTGGPSIATAADADARSPQPAIVAVHCLALVIVLAVGAYGIGDFIFLGVLGLGASYGIAYALRHFGIRDAAWLDLDVLAPILALAYLAAPVLRSITTSLGRTVVQILILGVPVFLTARYWIGTPTLFALIDGAAVAFLTLPALVRILRVTGASKRLDEWVKDGERRRAEQQWLEAEQRRVDEARRAEQRRLNDAIAKHPWIAAQPSLLATLQAHPAFVGHHLFPEYLRAARERPDIVAAPETWLREKLTSYPQYRTMPLSYCAIIEQYLARWDALEAEQRRLTDAIAKHPWIAAQPSLLATLHAHPALVGHHLFPEYLRAARERPDVVAAPETWLREKLTSHPQYGSIASLPCRDTRQWLTQWDALEAKRRWLDDRRFSRSDGPVAASSPLTQPYR